MLSSFSVRKGRYRTCELGWLDIDPFQIAEVVLLKLEYLVLFDICNFYGADRAHKLEPTFLSTILNA
jgi:hypothetical protein